MCSPSYKLPKPSKTVVASLGGGLAASVVASRGDAYDLLDAAVGEARRRGARPHQVVAWVRRKHGRGGMVVWRRLADGALSCATPCVLCRRALLRFDLRITCSQAGGAWWRGRLSDAGAPPSVFTRCQREQICPGRCAALKPQQQQQPAQRTQQPAQRAQQPAQQRAQQAPGGPQHRQQQRRAHSTAGRRSSGGSAQARGSGASKGGGWKGDGKDRRS